MLEKSGEYKPKFIFSTGDVSEILGVSRQTLSDWKKDDCPFLGKGKWDLAAVVQWDRARFANRQVTPEEKETLWRNAAETGLSLSEYIRFTLLYKKK